MKRIIASLLTLIMLVTVTPVVMAANLDFSGKISTEATQAEEFGGTSEIELAANIGDNLKAGISFGDREKSFPWTPWNLDVKGLWLETNGALIPGTPEFTTRIGSLNANYSDFIASGVKTTGISMDQLAIGPVTIGGYYSLDSVSNLDRGAYVKANLVEGIEAQATVVKAEEQLSYAVSTAIRPIEPAEVSGTYAAIQDGEQAYRVDGKYQLLEGLQVRAGYQDVPAQFAPSHMTDDQDKLEHGTGFTVGATAKQYGFEVAADYADYHKTVDYSVKRTLNVAGMDFNTKLAGDFNIENSEATELEASVAYNAPNGMELSVGYDFIDNQPKASAGLELKF
jgi:hypothetical protein